MSRFLLLLSFLLVFPLAAAGQSSPDSGDVVINEIMYAPAAGSEYIELYNRSATAVNLGRLVYGDANRDFDPVADTDTLLQPGQYVVLVRDPTAFRSAFPAASFLAPGGWEGLNNGGDTVFLRDRPSGKRLDAVPYDASWGGSNGAALERIDPAGPSNRSSNFGPSEAAAGGTPAARNSIFAPDTTAPVLQTVSPTPSGDSVRVRFSEPVDGQTVSASAFELVSPGAPSVVRAAVTDTLATEVVCILEEALAPGTYSLVATNVADRQDNVRAQTQDSFRYFVPATPAPKDLVVTEILYAPRPASNEFVEIYNRSDSTVNLGALEYADEDRAFSPLTEQFVPIPPDSHAVIVRDAAAFQATFPDVAYQAPAGWEALNNGGDVVFLRHAPSATVLDSVPYAPSWGGRDGHSLERIDPAAPSNAASNFASSAAPAGATPGMRNSRYNPDNAAPVPVFAEQTSERQVEVTFSEALRPASVTPNAFSLSTPRVQSARLARDTVVTLSLSRPPSGPAVAVSGVQDRVGNTQTGAEQPLAYRPEDGDIVVNEILFDPRADDFDNRPNQVEYVELRNRTDRPRSLRGLYTTDRPNEQNVADTVRVGRRQTLSAHGYAVMAAAPAGARNAEASQLTAAFPQAPLAADSVAFLPVDARRLGLGNDGDLVRLHRADDTLIAEVSYSPDWHAPGLEAPKGTALERISAAGNPESPDNWTSSTAPAGGTPGRQNAVTLGPPPEASQVGLVIEPSPFSVERDGATRIRYTLDTVPSLVRARIFDARGRKVRTLEDARLAGRTGELVWNGRDDSGNRVRIGVYVVLFEAVQTDDGTVARFKEPVVVARPLN